jgi:hypothetical protein
MFQRADQPQDPDPRTPTPIDQRTPGERRLTTADLAEQSQPHPEQTHAEGSEHTTSNVTPIDAGSQRPTPVTRRAPENTPLFRPDDSESFRSRWTDIQAGFVDEPRHAVEQADELVASVIKRLAEAFADERSQLERQWDRGEDVSTEDLRIGLQRYRSFFDRLLNV